MTSPSAPRSARLGVWALLVLLAAVGVWLSGTGGVPQPGPAPVAAEQVVSDGQLVIASHVQGHTVIPGFGDRYAWSGGDRDTIELLPAWRWSGDVQLFNNTRGLVAGGASSGLDTVAGLFFGLAGFVWQALLAVLKFGLTTDVAGGAGAIINSGFAALGGSLLTSGVVVIVLLLGLVAVLRAMMKVRVGQALRVVMIVLVPLGLMFSLTGAAGGGGGANSTGSPAWIASQGNRMVDEIGVGLGSGFGFGAGDAISDVFGEESVNANIPTGDTQHFQSELGGCYAYTTELYGQYELLSTRSGAGSGTNLDAGGDLSGQLERIRRQNEARATHGASRQLVANVSMLWQNAYLNSWVSAQYGGPDGHWGACHRLESINGTPTSEQAALYRTSGAGELGPAAFRSYGDTGDQQAAMLAFFACTPGGGVQDLAGSTTLELDGPCGDWASQGDDGHVVDELRDDDLDDVAGATINADSSPQTAAFHSLYTAVNGANPTERLTGGIMATVGALIYMYALGGLAIGAIIAQFGLVALLILLPVTLTLLALPDQSGQGRNPMGTRLMKMTLAFFGAKLGLVVVMTLLMQLIVVFQQLVGDDANGLGGFLHLLIPVAALMLVRTLLKAMGFGDLASLRGSVGMATSAAVSSGGIGPVSQGTAKREQWQNKLRRSKAGGLLDKADQMVKRKTTGLAAAKAAALGGSAKKRALDGADAVKEGLRDGVKGGALGMASSLAGEDGERAKSLLRAKERAQLAKEGIVGKRDEDGEKVEDGIVARALAVAPKVAALGAAAERVFTDRDEDERRSVAERLAKLSPKAAAKHELRQNQKRRRQAKAARLRGAEAAGKTPQQVYAEMAGEDLEGSQLRRYAQHNQMAAKLNEEIADPAAHIPLIEADANGEIDPARASRIIADHQKKFVSFYKDDIGYERNQVLVSPDGLSARAIPTGRAGQVPGGLTTVATIKEARNPVHYLPKEIKLRRPDESDYEYAARLDLSMVELGWMDAQSGQTIDYLVEMGIDPDTEYGREQIELAVEGKGRLVEPDMAIQVTGAQLAGLERSFQAHIHSASTVASQAAQVELRAEVVGQLTAAADAFRDQVRELEGRLAETARDLMRAEREGNRSAVASLNRQIDALVNGIDVGDPELDVTGIKQLLAAGREDLGELECLNLVTEIEEPSESRNKKLKMAGIAAKNDIERVEKQLDEALRAVASSQGVDVGRRGQDLVKAVEDALGEQFGQAQETARGWKQASIKTSTALEDRRREADRAQKAARKTNSRTHVANLIGSVPKGLPVVEAKQLD